jgi:preprotein translocase subunit YajC
MTFDFWTAPAVVLAQAASPAGGQQSPFGMLTFMIPMFIILYFVMIRPQRNKQKQAENMQKSIAAGDEIVTIGGAHGVITTVREKTVVVRLVEGKVEFDRSAIAARIPKSDGAPASAELVVENNK